MSFKTSLAERTPADEPAPRLCPACGRPLTPHEGEKPARFRARKYCNRDCFQKVWAKSEPRSERVPSRGSERQRHSRGLALPDKATPPLEDLGKRRDYGRVEVLGEPCPEHPSSKIGFYGCPACVAGKRWAEQQRAVSMRPSPEGGR